MRTGVLECTLGCMEGQTSSEQADAACHLAVGLVGTCAELTLPDFLPCMPQFVEFAQATILEWPAPDTAYVLSEQQASRGSRCGEEGGSQWEGVVPVQAVQSPSGSLVLPQLCLGAASCVQCTPCIEIASIAASADPKRSQAAAPLIARHLCPLPQVLFYCLDALPIIACLCCYILFPPGYLLPPGGPAAAHVAAAPTSAITAVDLEALSKSQQAQQAQQGDQLQQQDSPKEDLKMVTVDLHS